MKKAFRLFLAACIAWALTAGSVFAAPPSGGTGILIGHASSPFLGLIGSRNLVPDSSNNNNGVNSEVGAIAVEAIPSGSQVKIVIPSFKLNTSSPPNEVGNGSGTSQNVWCSLQYDDGGGQADIGNCTFSAAASGTQTDKSYIVSDFFTTTKAIPAGALYKTRVFIQSTSAICASSCFVDVGTAARVSNATYGDKEIVGPATMNNLANGSSALTTGNAGAGTTQSTVRVAPSFLLAQTHQGIMLAGDSIGAGFNGTFSADQRFGIIGTGIPANTYAYLNFSTGGAAVACWRFNTNGTGSCGGTLTGAANYATNRLAWIAAGWANNLVVELGTNDKHLGANSKATIESDLTWLYGNAPAGTRIIQATITWKVTATTDSYATAAGQTTADASGGTIDLFNADVRNVAISGQNFAFDVSALFENQISPTYDGKWAVTGAANYCTTDGIHPTQACYVLGAAGVDVTKFKTNGIPVVIIVPAAVWTRRRHRRAVNDNADRMKEAA